MIYDAAACGAYMRKRYLGKATEVQVSHRHDAIRANVWTAPPPGSPSLHSDPEESAFWARKFTEVRTERLLRAMAAGIYRGTPESFVAFDEVNFLRNLVLDPSIQNSVRSLVLPSDPFLVRFTDARYVDDALQRGSLRIAPAAIYDDPSLNAAQRDDELTHAAVTGERRIAAQLIGFLPGEDASQARPMPVEWGEMFEYMNSANFYVLCLTDRFDARMFRDFSKDAAIIIRNPADFLSRLKRAVRNAAPNLDFKAERVHYYDPYTVERAQLVPGYSKNFAFTYQREFRPTWWPKDKTAQLSPFFVEIGDMTDIAEAVYLPAL